MTTPTQDPRLRAGAVPAGPGAWSERGVGGTVGPQIHVNSERCVGCQECVIRCPAGALDLDPLDWKAVGNDELCVGCRQCVRTCPFGAIEVEGPVSVPPRVAVDAPAVGELAGSIAPTRRGFRYAEAMQEAERCLNCPDPTCVLGCPAHNDIPAFIAAIRDEDWDEAHAVLRQTSMMPDICSIVCDQTIQCEGACSWKLAGGQPVAIGLLERFVTEQQAVPEVHPAAATAAAPRVAVVGSGPAGMAAAWELIEGGAEVTMYERQPVTGGVLAWGIPEFTLPERVARRPMEALERAGLEVRTDADVDDAALARLREDYDGVVLAQGASNPSRLPVPGADAQGVVDATTFLRHARLALATGQRHLPGLGVGAHVLVVGAGNTAMDVARSARRLGCQVTAIDWFDRRFAVVRDDELLEAEHEGVRIVFNRVVDRFDVDEGGQVVAARLFATRQQRASAMPRPIRNRAERIEVDRVVLATGYRVGGPVPSDAAAQLPVRPPDPNRTVPERSLMGSGLTAGSPKLTGLVRKRAALQSHAEAPVAASVWAAGDSLSGPSTVVGSMAQGRAAARSLLLAVGGRGTGADDEPARTVAARFGGNGVGGGERPAAPVSRGRWLPAAGVALGLALEAVGIGLLAGSRAWFPAVVPFALGAVLGLTGLQGWIGGWVRAQEP